MQLILLAWLFYNMSKTVNCFEVSEGTGDHVDCVQSRIDHNVTLNGGQNAGSFLKANKSIETMKKCIKQCCNMKGCDVAFFNNGECYSVLCRNIESCAPMTNVDKRMQISISYVAKPHQTNQGVSQIDKTAEPAITDNFISEVTKESPFLLDNASGNLEDDDSDLQIIRAHRENWRETKDMILAIGCGFIAVAAGVIGVIMMTRKLVEDDDIFIDYGEPASYKLDVVSKERRKLEQVNSSKQANKNSSTSKTSETSNPRHQGE